MYMGVINSSPESEILRELEGARVLVTGLTASQGVDLARAFADVKTRLIVHTNDLGPEITALIAVLSQSAAEIKVFTDPLTSPETAVRLTQNAARAFGGLDAVINLASLSHSEMAGVGSEQEIEDLVTSKLSHMAQITNVAANRMRVILSEGLVLNVLTTPHLANGREAAVAAIARAALAAMTKTEADAWADQAVRINAVGPRVTTASGGTSAGACLTNEPDLAALALYLVSKRGRSLSGHVFDADGVSNQDMC